MRRKDRVPSRDPVPTVTPDVVALMAAVGEKLREVATLPPSKPRLPRATVARS